ncbi:HEL186Cp [Eremothecium sinecaudum]|uniref:HEL186Cp n=1 Tax=Eremothecium sinecaudum TaxID=45286 RepID=A0A0X8HTE5_9SACH|nr:HEL186Cp [Eremothecium sinecaudum]AMD21095.1 HEL186Cp [Eremothecium sinecaudum]
MLLRNINTLLLIASVVTSAPVTSTFETVNPAGNTLTQVSIFDPDAKANPNPAQPTTPAQPANPAQPVQPNPAQPNPAQPAPAQPAPAQPAPAQPNPAQTTPTQTPAQTTPAQPAPAQPAPAQPAPAQPAPAQPAPAQPAPAQPAAGQPAAGQPAAGQPAPGQAAPAQPAAGQPAPAQDVGGAATPAAANIAATPAPEDPAKTSDPGATIAGLPATGFTERPDPTLSWKDPYLTSLPSDYQIDTYYTALENGKTVTKTRGKTKVWYHVTQPGTTLAFESEFYQSFYTQTSRPSVSEGSIGPGSLSGIGSTVTPIFFKPSNAGNGVTNPFTTSLQTLLIFVIAALGLLG